ncbi:MAG: ABC transporter permease [Acidobacteria bacterium]|nr:ABC transporter permease [Acidobacteriota bacterium]
MLQDLIYAVRTLRRSPLFLLVAVASLALGIGANTAIFSILNQALLRQLPVERPQELVQLDYDGATMGMVLSDKAWSFGMYQALRQQSKSLSGMMGHYLTPFSFSEGGVTERVRGDIVTGGYFQVLGIRALAGRLISMEEEKTPGAHPVVVLSHGFWQQRFGGNMDVLNRKVLINGQPMTVIGITERGFNGVDLGALVDVWAPAMMKKQLTPTWDGLDSRQIFWMQVYGRRKAGFTTEMAKAELVPLYQQQLRFELDQMKDAPERFRKLFLDNKLVVQDGSRGAGPREALFQPLTVLMAMVGMVLLIACANLANLLMARSAARQKEIAIRLAMGASRGRIVRQLLVESTALGIAGGVAGLVVATWTADFLGASMGNATPQDMVRFGQLIDWRVMLFNFALSIMTGLIFGLIPALQATRRDTTPALKDGASNASGSGSHVRFRKGLIAAQVALSVLLLASAGLFARSLYNLKANDTGFRAESLVQFKVDAPLLSYTNPRALDFYQRLQERLLSVPGVTRASMTSCAVMEDCIQMRTVMVQGYQPKDGENLNPLVLEVGPDYFKTLGIPLLQGRDLSHRDGLTAPKVAVVNQAFASYFFKSENPIGRRIRFGRPNVFDIEIVGVVKDAKHGNVREKIWRQIYLAYGQNDTQGELTYYVRAGMDPAALGAVIRREVSRLDANMPVAELRTLDSQIDRLITTERLVAALAMAFGVLATLLATVGLYGVMAFMVARRTREIGIRMALGALRGSVLWLVMREVALVTGIGIAVGLPLAYGAGHLVQSQLFGVEAWDLAALAGATLVIAVAAALAGFLPARRATSIDPINALRYE